jgi:Nucleotidyl transferase of unknown function (DUF2204)
MESIDPRKLLVEIASILDKNKIPYLITGGMAVFVWGRPRFTADIDLIVELSVDKLIVLEKALKSLDETGYVDADVMREALAESGEFNFIDGKTGMKVDFWVSTGDSFDRSRLKRRVSKKIIGHDVYFSTPEDLILSKLRWWRDTGSTRHKEDIVSIISISGEGLDQVYLANWAEKLGYTDLLDEAFKK